MSAAATRSANTLLPGPGPAASTSTLVPQRGALGRNVFGAVLPAQVANVLVTARVSHSDPLASCPPRRHSSTGIFAQKGKNKSKDHIAVRGSRWPGPRERRAD